MMSQANLLSVPWDHVDQEVQVFAGISHCSTVGKTQLKVKCFFFYFLIFMRSWNIREI